MATSAHPWLPGVHASQAGDDPELYDVDNGAVDPDGLLDKAMWTIAP